MPPTNYFYYLLLFCSSVCWATHFLYFFLLLLSFHAFRLSNALLAQRALILPLFRITYSLGTWVFVNDIDEVAHKAVSVTMKCRIQRSIYLFYLFHSPPLALLFILFPWSCSPHISLFGNFKAVVCVSFSLSSVSLFELQMVLVWFRFWFAAAESIPDSSWFNKWRHALEWLVWITSFCRRFRKKGFGQQKRELKAELGIHEH